MIGFYVRHSQYNYRGLTGVMCPVHTVHTQTWSTPVDHDSQIFQSSYFCLKYSVIVTQTPVSQDSGCALHQVWDDEITSSADGDARATCRVILEPITVVQ